MKLKRLSVKCEMQSQMCGNESHPFCSCVVISECHIRSGIETRAVGDRVMGRKTMPTATYSRITSGSWLVSTLKAQ